MTEEEDVNQTVTMPPMRPVEVAERQEAEPRARDVVFDVQGRAMERVVDDAWREAGPHEVRLDVAGWRPGLYLCRLAFRGSILTGKLVIAR